MIEPLPNAQPRAALPLEYEQRFQLSVQRRWLRAGLLLVGISLLLTAVHPFLFLLLPAWGGPSMRAFFAVLAGYGDILQLLALIGGWVLCGFDWSGRREMTAWAWVLRVLLGGLVALSVLQSMPQLLGLPPTQFGLPSATFWRAYGMLFWSAMTALFLHVWLALRAFEGRARPVLAISIFVLRLLTLVPVLISLRMGNEFAFIRTHQAVWRWMMLSGSAASAATGVLLFVAAQSLRRPGAQSPRQ